MLQVSLFELITTFTATRAPFITMELYIIDLPFKSQN